MRRTARSSHSDMCSAVEPLLRQQNTDSEGSDACDNSDGNDGSDGRYIGYGNNGIFCHYLGLGFSLFEYCQYKRRVKCYERSYQSSVLRSDEH